MTAQLLSGAPVAEAVLARVRARSAALARRGVQPTLAMVLVGDNPDSVGYVLKKHEASASAGIATRDVRVAADAPPGALIEQLRQLNADPTVHGVIVQSPLPPGFDFHSSRGRARSGSRGSCASGSIRSIRRGAGARGSRSSAWRVRSS
jgi:methylenetetrahydrofolate dehydrogenase (NADP+)/methenyltetrahydrofolate cyclohydrolase